MGTGRQLGRQLQQWLKQNGGDSATTSGTALANRWGDALGSDDGLKAPLRDLASRPLFRLALNQEGASQRATLEQLSEELRRTYSPEVMAELLDLLEAFAGLQLPRPVSNATGARSERASRTRSSRGSALDGSLRRLGRHLEPIAPGIALAAAAALVWMWVGRELDRLLFEAWGWSGGAVLVLVLALIEALGLGPLRPWQKAGLLPATSLGKRASGSRPQAWKWITAPWQQPSRRQAALNLVLLAVILGPSSLQLPDVLLRYGLVSLATIALAALVSSSQPTGEGINEAQAPGLGGASGAVASLIGLGVGLSLLQGRALGYGFGPLAIPAWVLLLIDAGFELSWLARERQEDGTRLWNRQELLRQPWSWGLLLGLAWAVLSQVSILWQAWSPPG